MKVFISGENLRITRQEKGVSQEAMASLLNISQTKYSRMERDKAVFSYQQIREIAKILDVPEAKLLPPSDVLEQPVEAGLGLGRNAKKFLKSITGKAMILVSAYVIVNIVYTAVKGACSGLGTSDNTMKISGMTAAFLTTAFIFYWIKKNKIWR
jgi:transcriptional regulator with XRE-family HTH domain